MKKVTAFVGSARKKHTHDAVVQLLSNLQSMGDSDYYYPTRLGASKKGAGKLFDLMSACMARAR
jgi:hypothetical protein